MTLISATKKNKFRPMACGFHSHSDLSLDGGVTIEQKVARAVELGRPADCLTDHGLMNGLAMHHQCCSKKKIMAIMGIEAYVLDPYEPTKKVKIRNEEVEVPNFAHLTIHFKTQEAYQHFCRLTPKMEERAVVVFGERKPLLAWEELESIAGQIVIGSGCLVSFVQKHILNGRVDRATHMYEKIRALAGPENFYVEIFGHEVTHNWKSPGKDETGKPLSKMFVPNECDPVSGLPKDIQKDPNEFVIMMARKYGDRLIFSEDSHLSTQDDKAIQDCRLSNGVEAWRFYTAYSMESSDFWADKFQSKYGFSDRDVEEIIDNSYHFIEHFKDYKFHTAKDGWFLPDVITVFGDKYEGKSNKDILKELIKKSGRMPTKDHPEYLVYTERLKYEVSVLSDNGKLDLLPYFFTLADICDWATESGILVNVRGSAGGVLIAYLLGMSVTDPVKWDLPFERFLTIERARLGLPDIDADFSDKGRVVDYIESKYGARAAPISINSLIKVKAAIRDVERMHKGEVTLETEMMCRSLPNMPQGVDGEKWLNGYQDKELGTWVPGFLEDKSPAAAVLKKYSIDNPEIWEETIKCLGIMRQKSRHACGIVLAINDLHDLIPMTIVGDELVTGFCPKSCEYIGLVKFDILGVSTLESLRVSMQEIEKAGLQKFTWGEFETTPSDYEKIIQPMRTAGLFQIKTHTMRPFVQSIQPRNTTDLSNLVALVRPGAMDAPAPDGSEMTAAEYFMAVRQGKAKPHYIHPDLEPILSETCSIVLFQEQVLRIFRDLAGYSYGTAEGVRRAIGKKIKEEMELHLGVLKTKLIERGWNQSQATALVETILASANYGFNKAHSASYGIVANNGIYLKSRYPLYFYLGELQSNIDDQDKTREIMTECRDLILPPNVTISHPTSWKIENEKLRAPLTIIKGVGSKAASSLSLVLQQGLSGLAQKPAPIKKPKKEKAVKVIDTTAPLSSLEFK
jgi:DNA polymerase-3 subunit alpha